MAKVESLENQILSMHTANDEREDLIQVLDNRDADLRSQHAELQSKLIELQNKKMQVDELVAQLQTFNEEGEEDVGKSREYCGYFIIFKEKTVKSIFLCVLIGLYKVIHNELVYIHQKETTLDWFQIALLFTF